MRKWFQALLIVAVAHGADVTQASEEGQSAEVSAERMLLFSECGGTGMYESALAGVIAALVATAVLGVARFSRHRFRRRKDIDFIRNLVAQGLPPVLEVPVDERGFDIVNSGIRASRFNPMARKLRYALENWTMYLTHEQREDVLDALDWFEAEVRSEHLSREMAIMHLEKLESITWLGFRADDSLRTTS